MTSGNVTRDLSKVASTTGNITGLYDTSGGANENVMGNYNNTVSLSIFSAFPESKYYDKYTSTSSLTACNGDVCLGHALSETSSWYSDTANFLPSGYPWFTRGGYYGNGSKAGAFRFNGGNGDANATVSFRLVLSIGA